MLHDPPQTIIDRAIQEARTAPCVQSKRGAVVYNLDSEEIIGVGFNRPPSPLRCEQGGACRAAHMRCAQIAVHAEQAALDQTLAELEATTVLRRYGLVHVKVDLRMGQLVAGKGPCCWQCARRILELKVGAIFLYEEQSHPISPPAARYGAWTMYDAEEFHAATLKSLKWA